MYRLTIAYSKRGEDQANCHSPGRFVRIWGSNAELASSLGSVGTDPPDDRCPPLDIDPPLK
jgi:hypothetical protein